MRIGFRTKVLLAISTLTLLASVAISVSFYNRSAQTVGQNYVYSLQGTLSVFVQAFEDTMRNAYDVSVQLADSAELADLISNYLAKGGKVEDAFKITNYLKQYQPDGGYIDSIYIYLTDKKQVITSTEYHAVQEIFYPEQYSWLNLLAEEPEGTRLTPVILQDRVSRAPRYVLTYYRPIRGEDGSDLGAVAVNLNERYLFYQLLNTGEQERDTRYFLVDGNGVIGSAASTSQIGQNISDLTGIGNILSYDPLAAANLEKDQIVVSVRSPMTGYGIVSLSSRSSLLQSLQEQQVFIMAALVITLILVLLLAMRISTWLYRPVKELKQTMEKVSAGDLSARAPVRDKDEIGVLSEGFNETVSHVEALIGELVNERMQKKEAELDALQYQITPHFMYNTLNSIKYAAILQKSDRIAEQLGAFIELLQASINRKGAFLTVKEELRMVKNYVMLQQFRYMDSFDVKYHVDPAVEEFYVPRLILQPLVENAILHGINLEKGNCLIVVSVQCSEDNLELSVSDNGEGMSEEQVAELMSFTGGKRTQRGHFSGIGIPNILDRLRLYYADRGALHYYSTIGVGTHAVITLPASMDPAEYEI
ncbi:MAG TPA: sensor histidine kinase [Anaerovoracaceae bacterium]|nr:sensor histidine kinase [Anaerovoracaceae bacterium]